MVGIPQAYFEEGIGKAISNGDELVNAAKLLFDKGIYSPSVFLAYQGIEEYGKAMLLIDDMQKETIEISQYRWNKLYRSHNKKLARVRKAIEEYLYKETEYTEGKEIPVEEIVRASTEWAFLDKTRNMYVNWDFKKNSWVSPQDVLDLKIDASGVLIFASNTKMALKIILEK